MVLPKAGPLAVSTVRRLAAPSVDRLAGKKAVPTVAKRVDNWAAHLVALTVELTVAEWAAQRAGSMVEH